MFEFTSLKLSLNDTICYVHKLQYCVFLELLDHNTFPVFSKNLKIEIYKTIVLLVVLYGCETWSLALREERRLRVFENRIMRRIFGPKRDENGD